MTAAARPQRSARPPRAPRTTGRGRQARVDGAAAVAPRRNRKRLLVSALVVVVLAALGAVAWFTPLFAARTISVSGNVGVPTEEILAALAIPAGTPLLQVDAGGAASRVAAIAKVDRVRVARSYPSTVEVTVVERAPAVFYDAPEGTRLMDGGGVSYAIEPPPPGVPRLKVDRPGHDDPATLDALTALNSMPPQLRGQVTEISAPTVSDIRVSLGDGRQVLWGSADNSERKAAIAVPLLGQPGQVFDVSSPDLPTTR
ncbi:cell division protein FtsQ/DivIB [Rhodococcus kronopolitis]|uniref:Cell division protein FtsQ/DivIB n=1 Tax=Rhodococcus kronopolitis TaxID=1460226 RepID=A0ABV9FK86_9NOCA